MGKSQTVIKIFASSTSEIIDVRIFLEEINEQINKTWSDKSKPG